MFLTGEFSKIARISKRKLQYYDEIGLFSPAETDPQTGYRYYSAKQLPTLNKILALQDLGLSLDQIRRMMGDNIGEEEIHGMLLMKKAEAERELLDAIQRFRRIESRINHKDPADVVLKSVKSLQYYSMREVIPTFREGFAVVHSLTNTIPDNLRDNGQFMAMIHNDEFTFENVDVEFGLAMNQPLIENQLMVGEHILRHRQLPAYDQLVTVTHVGGPYTSNIGYGAIGAWIEDNGYEIIGPQRELFLEISQHEPEIVMELQFPVRRILHDNHLLNNVLNE